jgi:hypothetical protein
MFFSHDAYAVDNYTKSQSPISSEIFQTMFSNSLNDNASSTDQDPMHRFSISRPHSWFVKDEPWSDDPHIMSTFWNRDFDHTAFLVIFRNATVKSVDWNSVQDKEIRNVVYDALIEQHMNASETNITRYSDGLKIVSVGLVTDDQGTFSKQKITTYWFSNGLKYDIKYITDPPIFNQYLDDVQKSIDTFYVAEKPSQITSYNESSLGELQKKSYLQVQLNKGNGPNLSLQKQGEDMQNIFYVMVTGIPIFVTISVILFWFTRK